MRRSSDAGIAVCDSDPGYRFPLGPDDSILLCKVGDSEDGAQYGKEGTLGALSIAVVVAGCLEVPGFPIDVPRTIVRDISKAGAERPVSQLLCDVSHQGGHTQIRLCGAARIQNDCARCNVEVQIRESDPRGSTAPTRVQVKSGQSVQLPLLLPGDAALVIRPSRDKMASWDWGTACLLYTSPSPRDQRGSRMPSSA